MHDRFPIFAALDQEWRQFSDSCGARAALQRWRRVEPALAGLDTVEDVLALRRDPHRADEVLGALVSRSARDQAAARVVLQALMPGLVRLPSNASTHRTWSHRRSGRDRRLPRRSVGRSGCGPGS